MIVIISTQQPPGDFFLRAYIESLISESCKNSFVVCSFFLSAMIITRLRNCWMEAGQCSG